MVHPEHRIRIVSCQFGVKSCFSPITESKSNTFWRIIRANSEQSILYYGVSHCLGHVISNTITQSLLTIAVQPLFEISTYKCGITSLLVYCLVKTVSAQWKMMKQASIPFLWSPSPTTVIHTEPLKRFGLCPLCYSAFPKSSRRRPSVWQYRCWCPQGIRNEGSLLRPPRYGVPLVDQI